MIMPMTKSATERLAAIVPFDGLEHISRVVDDGLGLGGDAIGEFLASGDELLVGGIPVNPGIGRHVDLCQQC